jgi:hypothetical protein
MGRQDFFSQKSIAGKFDQANIVLLYVSFSRQHVNILKYLQAFQVNMQNYMNILHGHFYLQFDSIQEMVSFDI